MAIGTARRPCSSFFRSTLLSATATITGHTMITTVSANARERFIRASWDSGTGNKYTAIVVVISYATLLVIDARFIVLAVFPFIALAFIAALCVALVRAEADNGGAASSSASSAAATDHKGKKTTTTAAEEAEQLTAMSVVPYWALCATGHSTRATDLAVTQFLLFLSATLGALVLMLTRLRRLHDAGVVPGVAPASELAAPQGLARGAAGR
uniref:Uncharacterized protein n=1 Tax=Oryza glumipatula TaxID=40148 RepID=A0A0D9Y7Z5_9ORYZ